MKTENIITSESKGDIAPKINLHMGKKREIELFVFLKIDEQNKTSKSHWQRKNIKNNGDV